MYVLPCDHSFKMASVSYIYSEGITHIRGVLGQLIALTQLHLSYRHCTQARNLANHVANHFLRLVNGYSIPIFCVGHLSGVSLAA